MTLSLCCKQVNEANSQQIMFIADDANRCLFWRCLGRRRAVMMACAPGTQLRKDYTAGNTNPCVRRVSRSDKDCVQHATVRKPTKDKTNGVRIQHHTEHTETMMNRSTQIPICCRKQRCRVESSSQWRMWKTTRGNR